MSSLSTHHSDEVLRAFVDEVRAIDDAAEFERLMLGRERSWDENMRVIDDCHDLFWISVSLWADREESALDDLRCQQALERLSSRYPEVWEAVQVAA